MRSIDESEIDQIMLITRSKNEVIVLWIENSNLQFIKLWLHFVDLVINMIWSISFSSIDFIQHWWESRYSRKSRTKLLLYRARFVISYSTYSTNNALTLIFFLKNYVLIISSLCWLIESLVRMRFDQQARSFIDILILSMLLSSVFIVFILLYNFDSLKIRALIS